jgi:CelD/BcsL family acetyltransferase involved in cellulose biosynthesis
MQIERVESISGEWDRLADDGQAAPFLRPGWITAWWHAFGDGSLRALTVRNGDRLAGIVPLIRQGRVLRSPTNSETPLFGSLSDGDDSARQLASALLSIDAGRLDLSFLSSDDPVIRHLIEAARTRQFRTITRQVALSPYLSVADDWGAYESSLDAKFRSEIRRRRRRLAERGDLRLEVVVAPERLETVLTEGFRVERSGWKGEYGTAIESDPRTRRFYLEAARWASERGWLVLAFLRLDGRSIAFDLCLETGGIHYLLKTGFDHGFRSFAPGVLLRSMMLERAFSAPIETYEFLGTVLGTNNRWKLDWTDRSHERVRFAAFGPSLVGTAGWYALKYAIPLADRARVSIGRALGPSGRHLVKRGRRLLRHQAQR